MQKLASKDNNNTTSLKPDMEMIEPESGSDADVESADGISVGDEKGS